MKIIETLSNYCDCDYDADSVTGIDLKITCDNGDKGNISISEGEPEDMSFGRDLSDVLSISDLLKIAYDAGKRGEEFVYECINDEDED